MLGLAIRCTKEPHLKADIPGTACEVVYDSGATTVDISGVQALGTRRFDWLFMYGGHGNFVNFTPTQLNNLSADAAEELVARLLSLQITAQTIVLDCCFSAAFAPLFTCLLHQNGVRPGVILCHIASASGSFAGMIAEAKQRPADAMTPIRGACISNIQGKFTDFVSQALYLHRPGHTTLYRKTYTDLGAASRCYLSLLGANNEDEADDVEELDAYLMSLGADIKRVSEDELITVIRNALIS